MSIFPNPTREAGLSRLHDFIPYAGRDYARLRNSDFGPGAHEHVSLLSPYIRHRIITEREVVEAVLEAHGFEESEKFIQEVFWRTYFKGWLEHRPHVWMQYKAGVINGLKVLEKNAELRVSYTEACEGRTGIDCFDHWVQELTDTGYLHNHARMWFASIWIFTLKLPWELGADFFLRHLLDGDPASNTLSWRWVGGLHTKGKTYLARPENIERFTNGRFNPVGKLATIAEPLVEPEHGASDQNLPQTSVLPNQEFLLLAHEDDCHPETLLPQGMEATIIVGAVATSLRSPLAVGPKVKEFAHAAVTEALTRNNATLPLIEGAWAGSLISFCQHHDVSHIVTAYMPKGPVADALAVATPDLKHAGIEVTQIVRSWDRLTWPYANRGFFKVKKKMPKILEGLKSNDAQGLLL